MSAGCAVLWEEEGWRVRVLLEWQRLVNGVRVMAKRSGTVGVMGAHLRRPSEDAERGAQHVQPDEHEAGASSSCDAVTHDLTEASPRSQAPAAGKCINAPVTRTRRTDATLTLRYAARVQLTGHLRILDGEYVAKGLEYAYYTRLRGANGIRVYSHVFHA